MKKRRAYLYGDWLGYAVLLKFQGGLGPTNGFLRTVASHAMKAPVRWQQPPLPLLLSSYLKNTPTPEDAFSSANSGVNYAHAVLEAISCLCLCSPSPLLANAK